MTKKIDEKSKILFLLDEAHSLMREKKYRAASSLLKKAKKITHKNSVVLGSLARCYLQLGRLTQAEEIARQRFAHKKDLPAYIIYTQILLTKGKLAEAEVLARERVQLFGGAAAYGLLGQVLMTEGKLDEAEIASRENIRLSKNTAALGLLAEILRKKKRYRESLEVTEEVTEKNYSIFLCRAYCLMHLRRIEESLKSFQGAEKELNSGKNSQYADSFLRLHAGYIFLYEFSSGINIEKAKIREVARRAAGWLKACNESTIGTFQQSDYRNAMQLIAKNGL